MTTCIYRIIEVECPRENKRVILKKCWLCEYSREIGKGFVGCNYPAGGDVNG